MAADGSLTFDTKLDTDSFKKAMNNLSSTVSNGMKSVATRFSSGFSTLASHVKSFASTAAKTIAGFTAAAGAALTGAGGYAINLASDLTEVQNVVDVTFGENADQINQWAKSAATAFGLSELQAKQYTGTLGAMMKSMGLTDTEILTMSKDMVGLAGDFASFYNLDPEEAFEKIRSGISGETGWRNYDAIVSNPGEVATMPIVTLTATKSSSYVCINYVQIDHPSSSGFAAGNKVVIDCVNKTITCGGYGNVFSWLNLANNLSPFKELELQPGDNKFMTVAATGTFTFKVLHLGA